VRRVSRLDLRARRIRLGLTVAELAYAARVRAQSVVDPSLADALRIDAALTIIETGGCVEIARAASVPGRTGPVQRNRVDRPPPWPEHSGAENLSGQCFEDVGNRR